MNLATVLIGLAIAAPLALAVRYLVKNGLCAGCEMKESCDRAKKAAGDPHGCPGNCSACAYRAAEMKAAASRQPRTGVQR
jgi:hypothetical protein